MTTQNSHDRSVLSHDNVLQFDDVEDLSAVAPHSGQAEEAVLGSVLKPGLAIADVLPFLKPHHFYERRHEHIYAAMAALFERSAHIEHYARIVLEHAVRRRYIDAGQQVAELAWNQRKDLETVKQRAEARVLGASSDTLSRRAVLPPLEWTEHLIEYLGQARTDGLAGSRQACAISTL